jgi:hypothetical protein
VRCGRDIVTVLSSGSRHAVHVSMFCFYPLDDEVTERWLTEPCPGKRLPRDDDDRQRQVAKPSSLTLNPQPPKSRENRDRLRISAMLVTAGCARAVSAADRQQAYPMK